MTSPDPRLERLKQRTQAMMQKEQDDLADHIRSRSDYSTALDPFLQTLALAHKPSQFIQSTTGKVVMTMCIQAPPELFHAAGIQQYKLACGSHASGNMAPLHLPALTCPMIKSLAGLLKQETNIPDCVIPTTCDWVVKFSEIAGFYDTANIHFMELPHLRENERSSRRWLAEIKTLKDWIEETSGQKITPAKVLTSIQIYSKAFELYTRLINLRRSQNVPAIHFALITNALPFQKIEAWMKYTNSYLNDLNNDDSLKTPVFLTGSPIVFPNYKMLTLIENAGMAVTADDLCTMERSFPQTAVCRDKSEHSLLNALAQREHKACTCPTFADNQRRINNLVSTLTKHNINGVIFHVLKGCHPYDMESGLLENLLKEKGFRFLKIETDYVKEDEQNIVTRVEAFKRTLQTNADKHN